VKQASAAGRRRRRLRPTGVELGKPGEPPCAKTAEGVPTRALSDRLSGSEICFLSSDTLAPPDLPVARRGTSI